MTQLVRALALAGISGAILSFAWPEPDIAPLAWIAIAPLLIALQNRRAREGFAIAYLFGLGFFGALLVWISIVGWVAWAILVILEALFVGLFGAFYAYVRPRVNLVAGVVAAAAGWVTLEFLRSLVPVGGFSWGQLAQSQHNLPWMLKVASIAGSWGIAAVILGANACLAEAFLAWRSARGRGPGRGKGLRLAVIAALLVVAPLLLPANDATGEPLRVAIVQGNIPREMEQTFEKDVIIINNHVERTRALAGKDVDLIVWPESSVGIDPERVGEVGFAIEEAARAAGAPMIVGATLEADDPDEYLVVALLVSADGAIVDRYQKTHLVPFGERVPGRGLIGRLPILDQVPRDAIPGGGGANVEPFQIPGGAVSPVVSFEGDFGTLTRGRIAAGGRLLVIATNTSTWEDSWASAQHLAFAQVRAAETGTWVVHAALTGISGFVAPDGRVVERSEMWKAATLVADIRFAEDTTLYVKLGDWAAWAAILGCVGLLLMLRLRSRPDEVPASSDKVEERTEEPA